MKKLLYVAAAVLAFTACSKDAEDLMLNGGDGNVIGMNHTRAAGDSTDMSTDSTTFSTDSTALPTDSTVVPGDSTVWPGKHGHHHGDCPGDSTCTHKHGHKGGHHGKCPGDSTCTHKHGHGPKGTWTPDSVKPNHGTCPGDSTCTHKHGHGPKGTWTPDSVKPNGGKPNPYDKHGNDHKGGHGHGRR